MKLEPVLAKLNELRKDTLGEGGLEEAALYHSFCFISYEVGAFAGFVEQDTLPSEKKGVEPREAAKNMLNTLEELREDVSTDEKGMEYIALDRAAAFISAVLGDFQNYLNEAGEGLP